MFIGADRSFTEAVSTFVNDDDRPRCQFGARLFQDGLQPFDDVFRSSVVEAKEDDALDPSYRSREYFAEINVKRWYDTLI